MMNKELKKKWIEALRSGKYRQGYATLYNQFNESYCCLGVLCDIAPHIDNVDGFFESDGVVMSDTLTDYLAHEFGLCKWVFHNREKMYLTDKLMTMNDEDRFNFEQIASYLERIKF